MNISAILIQTKPEYLDAVSRDLESLPGIDLHHSDPATGRMIITQEAQSIPDEVDALKLIKTRPHVALAEMVYHCFEEDQSAASDLEKDLEALDKAPGLKVPIALQDV